ncbi:MAG: NfeD family protein [Sphingomicrobium sp.]|nr:NfeD family protein [Sphingomonadales bacterium]
MNWSEIEPGWWWAIGGVALLIAEVIAPGFFLIFIGAAALATGLFTLLFGLGTELQLVLFVIYAALAVLAGKRFYARPHRTSAHKLNDRAAQLVGRQVTVTEPIDADSGRVRLGDGEWSARGGPAAVGADVIIRRVEGNCLIVDPVPSPGGVA